MTTATDFRVFKIDAQFSGIQSEDVESIRAKLSASGKPTPFAFMLWVNFERDSQDSQSETVNVETECRVIFNRIPIQISPIQITIPPGQWSTTKNLGIYEVAAEGLNLEQKSFLLVIEFLSGQISIGRREYKVSFDKD
jgi:hypothetical protein